MDVQSTAGEGDWIGKFCIVAFVEAKKATFLKDLEI